MKSNLLPAAYFFSCKKEPVLADSYFIRIMINFIGDPNRVEHFFVEQMWKLHA